MNPRLTRNELLRRGAAGGALLAFPSLLAACGGGDGGGSTDGGELKTVLNFSNWPLYIDTEGKRHRPSTSSRSRRRSRSSTSRTINSNDEYFAKIQGPLSQGEGIDRDIIVVDRQLAVPRASSSSEGWVQKLDKELIPNIENLVDAQASPPFDPDREYSLPWQSGMTGIAWNEELTGAGDIDRAAVRGPEAEGEGDGAHARWRTRSAS